MTYLPRHSFVNLLGFWSSRRKINRIRKGAIVIVTMDKTTNAVTRALSKIPYVAAMLAVAKVVDI